eukprot:gene7594-9042_t
MSLREVLHAEPVYLTSNSWYIHIPAVMKVEKDVFEQLWNLRDNFDQQHLVMFGKRVPIPRRQGLFSTRDVSYKFSGISVPSRPLASHPFLQTLLDQVSDTHKAVFANWYETGQDYVGAHSDNEKDLARGSCIISVSLNATRTFRVKRKSKCAAECKADKIDFQLGGAFQREFLREVPKKTAAVEDARRINFTIRKYLPQDKSGMKRKKDQCDLMYETLRAVDGTASDWDKACRKMPEAFSDKPHAESAKLMDGILDNQFNYLASEREDDPITPNAYESYIDMVTQYPDNNNTQTYALPT